MTAKASAIERLWRGLSGKWQLKRILQSANAAEPSGTCSGTATFTTQEPVPIIDDNGKLQIASKQLLYTETGEFELSTNLSQTTPTSKFTFSRKYIWRLQSTDLLNAEISVWFTKSGTEKVDYLFHKFLVQDVDEELGITKVDCSGGHLCVEDYYSSSYTFHLKRMSDRVNESDLQSWTMVHEVRGPKKDQVIETHFHRP